MTSAVDENKAWENLHKRIANRAQGNKKSIRFSLIRVAAAAVLIIGFGLISYIIFNKENAPKELVLQSQQQVVNDTLPDGSMVTLNKRSSISYPSRFTGHTRKVVLKGEAFFNVSADKNKPFIISAGDAEITVVGTSFNVKNENEQTQVVVENGIVRVRENGKTIVLNAGERTTVSGAIVIPVKEKVTDKLYNYYRSREFVCDDTPLWKLIEVVNEAYDVNIIFGKKELRDLRMNTTFYSQPLDRILDIIHQTFDIQITRNGNQIILE
ncbi:MAG: FecR domain-containing protein [Ginsengibacter sp.]